MNITEQVIDAADRSFRFRKIEINREASNISDKDLLFSYYNEWNKKITNEVISSSYASEFLFRDILLYNHYESIAAFLHMSFCPVFSLAEIEFVENATVDFDCEVDKHPIVRKGYDFSRDNEEGVKITNYIANLYLLMEIRDKLGFDVNRYPGKCHVIVFEFENVLYVWENGHDRTKRLTIDQSDNQEIWELFIETFYTLKKSNNDLYLLLEGLPFIEGIEGQKKFDIIRYRYLKQTPLTYRCFPNINTINFPFPHVNTPCQNKGEYCIKPDKIELRYERFLNLLNALNENEKEELLLMTIDYFNKFLNIVYFENPIHKNIYTKILEKLNKIELPQGPNGELGNAILQLDREGYKKDMFDLTKRADVEAINETKVNTYNVKLQITNEGNVSESDTIPVVPIKLENNSDPDNTKLDATHFIGFMNSENRLKGDQIMNEVDYVRLLKYTQELMDYCRIPQNIKPIPKINLTKQEIVYTYSLIHDQMFPAGKLRKVYFLFLDKVFLQLHQSGIEIDKDDNYMKGNYYKKFRTKPDYYGYL